jgi:hypothetical protein
MVWLAETLSDQDSVAADTTGGRSSVNKGLVATLTSNDTKAIERNVPQTAVKALCGTRAQVLGQKLCFKQMRWMNNQSGSSERKKKPTAGTNDLACEAKPNCTTPL